MNIHFLLVLNHAGYSFFWYPVLLYPPKIFIFEQMTTPEGGISQGSFFGYGPGVEFGDQWDVESGDFKLNTEAGDNVFLYCIDADSKIRFLSGISNSGNWSSAGLGAEEYGEAMSALPNSLAEAAIVLPHQDNYFYNGSRSEAIFLLRADMLNPASWVGDDENRFGFPGQEVVSGAKTALAFAFSSVMGLCGLSALLL